MDTDPALRARQALAAPPSGAPSDALAQIETQLALLGRLAEVGVQIVEAIGRQVTGPPGAPFAAPAPKLFQGDIVLAFTRVARAVRLTVALRAKLAFELEAWRRGEAPAQAAEADTDDDSEAGLEPEVEPQERAEAVERFGGPEREARDDIYALLDRPAGEVIDLICRDLGLSPEWVRQAQEEAAADAAGAASVGFVPRPGDGRAPYAAATPGWRARHDASP